MTNNTRADEWTGCYDQGWQNLISPASFSHPAKFSRGLIFRIIEHALEDGLIQPGQTILDPFGGVALGALPALQNGLNWIGVELESKFVELGRQNIALWNSRFSGMPKWTGQAQLLQGDSRRLAEVVSGAGLVVGSPPYARVFEGQADKQTRAEREAKAGKRLGGGQINDARDYGSTPGQLATLPPGTPPTAVISSPSFAGNTGGRGDASRNPSTGSGRSVIDAALFDRHSGGMKKGTGSDPANLDHLPMGTPPTAIIASPPYVDSMEKSGGIDPDKSNHIGGPHSQMNKSDTRYGQTDGQLGAMKAGVAVVGSPPFENSIATNLHTIRDIPGIDKHSHRKEGQVFPSEVKQEYGSTPGQIGATQGQTFWEAAALIVEQCALLLPPGGAAIWVVKAYVKGGKIVDFPGQWQQLCESCGFETVHEHRAMLVKHQGVQQGAMEGTAVSKEVSHKSFFRRLSERRGAPKIDFETVLCTVKR